MSSRISRALARTAIAATIALAGAAVAVPTANAAPAANAASATSAASPIAVTTAAGLTAALAAAKPGQTISLAAGTYTGKFVAAANGTAAAPITLVGSRSAVLTTGKVGSGYALHVTGDNWRVTGLTVRTAAKGIVLDGSTGTVLSSLDIGSIGEEGVHFRTASSDSVLENSFVHDTGLTSAGTGEGVYIGSAQSNWAGITGSSGTPDRSDRVVVRNTSVWNTPAEGIDAKEGTTGGLITGNRFEHSGYSGANSADSFIDLKGNNYTVSGNVGSGTGLDAIQVHTVLSGWGNGHRIVGNGVTGGVPGYEAWVQTTSVGTSVSCKSSAAARGLSNIGCWQ